MNKTLGEEDLDVLFRRARTQRSWRAKRVTEDLLVAIYELAKWGPTINNTCPARFFFVLSPEAKQRLKPHLNPGNVEQTMAAPATAIVGYDLAFYDYMPKLSSKPGAWESWQKRSPAELQEAAFRSGSLQAGYLIVAARALGLDCGPMSGFNNEGVDREFFAGTAIKSNILCNLGFGDGASLRPRAGRLEFSEACRLL